MEEVILRYERQHYDAKITELEAYVARIQTHITNLEGYEEEMFSHWGGMLGESTRQQLRTMIKELNTCMQRVETIKATYQSTSDGYDRMSNAVKGTMDDQMEILNGINNTISAVGSVIP